MPQHHHEWIHQFQHFGDFRFDGLAGRATELILSLHAATALDSDRVVIVVFRVFVFRVRGLVRNGKVFEVGLDENNQNCLLAVG